MHAGFRLFLPRFLMVTQQLRFSREFAETARCSLLGSRTPHPNTSNSPEYFIYIRPAMLGILAADMGNSVMDLFEETGAYLRGHFRLTSGLHSGEYLQCAKVLAHPAYAERLGQDLAKEIRILNGNDTVDVVVSPAIGGIIIGHEVARALNARSLFTERDAATNEMTLRRGFEIRPGEFAVVIEDVITTGGSTKEVVQLARAAGARITAAASIIDRSGGRADVGAPRVSLEILHPVNYQPEECPLCQQGVPIAKPGSRHT